MTSSLASVIPPFDSLLSNGTDKQPPLDFHQGLVQTWDQDTGANVVIVAGSEVVNLPVLNSSDIVIINPGDTVGILKYRNTYFILGRIVLPGSNQLGNAAIAFGASTKRNTNFTITTNALATSASDVVTALIDVPPWADEALVLVQMDATLTNTTAGLSFVAIMPTINGIVGTGLIEDAVAGEITSMSASASQIVSNPGSQINFTGRATATATWTANVNNHAYIQATAIFRRVT